MVDTSEAPLIVSFAVGILAIVIIAKIIGLSIDLLLKFISNSVVGALMLLVVNVFGANIELTILKSLFCGVFGIPGVVILFIYEKFFAG
ncbi:MAG: pro-sigmaK processing inhibitor BofA family protein [Selenomonadaceae bacterium]